MDFAPRAPCDMLEYIPILEDGQTTMKKWNYKISMADPYLMVE